MLEWHLNLKDIPLVTGIHGVSVIPKDTIKCYRKWDSFTGSGVTGGTIVQYARNQGWVPPMINQESGHELDWDDVIEKDEQVIIDKNWIEGREVREPTNWNPVNELITYLEILFDSTENVGYVTKTWLKDEKHLPTQGCWDRTAGKLIQQLNKCDGDIGAVLGDYNKEAGAWIRFNPLDGKGCKNSNVTDFKYALVESDSMPIAEQNTVLRELELPIACLVHSGGKSLHAADKMGDYGTVDARDVSQYKVDLIEENISRTDSINIQARVMDATVFDVDSELKADIVLADVPCSGYGVIGKKPEIKYRVTPQKQEEIVILQRTILDRAAEYVKPGGVLVFSTCTIAREENEENMMWFMNNYPFKLESLDPYLPEELHSESTALGYLQLLPGVHKTDGFFIAKFRRK